MIGGIMGNPMSQDVVISEKVVQETQTLIEIADLEIRAIAKKAGVPDYAMERAMRDFAAHLRPHAGREPTIHRPRHYKGWWCGYAAGMRAQMEES